MNSFSDQGLEERILGGLLVALLSVAPARAAYNGSYACDRHLELLTRPLMPLSEGIKKLFRRKSQKTLQSNVASTLRSGRLAPPKGGKANASQNTETSTSSLLHQERSDTELSRDSFPRGDSVVEETPVVKRREAEKLDLATAKEVLSEEKPGFTAASADEPEGMASRGEKQVRDSSTRHESGDTEPSLDDVSPLLSDRRHSLTSTTSAGSDFNRDLPEIAASYNAIPMLEQTALPRGGISMDTQAVGRVQVCIRYPFGVINPCSMSNVILLVTTSLLVWHSTRNH